MSLPLSDFFEYLQGQRYKDMMYLEYGPNDYDIMDPITLIPNCSPSAKELRLALDIIDQLYPLFKGLPAEEKADALKDVLKISTSKKRLKQLRNFKRIVFKRLITIENNTVKLKRVIKN